MNPSISLRIRKLSIIIPVFDEERTLEQVLNNLESLSIPNWQKEIILVDDASTDRTKEILKKYENKYKIIYKDKNSGKGSSVKIGLEMASGDYILIHDADLEYNPREIPSLINELENRENEKTVIYGSRNLHHIKRRGMYIPRAGVWFVTCEFNLLFGTHLTDLWTCYKLFPKSATTLFSPGRFESELLFSARLIKNGYQIFEVPIAHRPRSVLEGKKIRYRDGLLGIWVLLKEWLTK